MTNRPNYPEPSGRTVGGTVRNRPNRTVTEPRWEPSEPSGSPIGGRTVGRQLQTPDVHPGDPDGLEHIGTIFQRALADLFAKAQDAA